jgi:hypothetical protein
MVVGLFGALILGIFVAITLSRRPNPLSLEQLLILLMMLGICIVAVSIISQISVLPLLIRYCIRKWRKGGAGALEFLARWLLYRDPTARTSIHLATEVIQEALDQFPADETLQKLAEDLSRANGRFLDNNNGTFTDLATGLMWQKEPLEDYYWTGSTRFPNLRCTFIVATLQCALSDVGGYTDWRLPTPDELARLVDTIIQAAKQKDNQYKDRVKVEMVKEAWTLANGIFRYRHWSGGQCYLYTSKFEDADLLERILERLSLLSKGALRPEDEARWFGKPLLGVEKLSFQANSPDVLRPEDVAALLGVKVGTVWEWSRKVPQRNFSLRDLVMLDDFVCNLVDEAFRTPGGKKALKRVFKEPLSRLWTRTMKAPVVAVRRR